MITAAALIVALVAAAIMTMIMIGAIYANRSALPMCVAMFMAIIAFGIAW